jgi:hypothetical protein
MEKEMKCIIVLLTSLFFVGCATSTKVTYNISSEPPQAPVDVNGVNMGSTPTTATLECGKQWVGLINSPDGWANASGKYEIKAYPPKGFGGQSQSKNIDPCQWKGKGNPSIQFDLGLEKVTPTQKIEITTINNSDSNIQKSIEALKTLRNAGVITEDEYKTKLLELVE